MIGAMMLLTGKWNKPGVYTVEEFDPDPFMDALNTLRSALAGGPTIRCWWTDGVQHLLSFRRPRSHMLGGRTGWCGAISAVLKDVVRAQRACKILLAQKAFSMFSCYPLLREGWPGRNGRERPVTRHGSAREEIRAGDPRLLPAYAGGRNLTRSAEIRRSCRVQLLCPVAGVRRLARSRPGCSCGLRLNPACSTAGGATRSIDPCAPGSRLGVTAANFEPEAARGHRGLSLPHALRAGFGRIWCGLLDCAGGERSAHISAGVKWINFGGGHHITRAGYDVETLMHCIDRACQSALRACEVYLEPGEAVVLNAGYLVCYRARGDAQRIRTSRSWMPRRRATCRTCWRCRTVRRC